MSFIMAKPTDATTCKSSPISTTASSHDDATYQSGDDARRYAVLQEVDVSQIQLPKFVLLRCAGDNAHIPRQNGEARARGRKTYAVWFGNPETGMPIPVEQIRPVRKTSRLLWFPGRLRPSSFAMGTRSTLAMVWLMNVEMTFTKSG